MTVWHTGLASLAAPRKVALLLGIFVALLGASVLAGWALDIPSLRSALSVGVPMRANAALALLMCGVALAALCFANSRASQRVVAAIGGLVALLGVLTMSQDLAGWDLGIDQWLIRDTTGTARFALPGRMSPPTAFALLLTGIALTLASRRFSVRWRVPVLSALATAVILVGAVALLGNVSERLTEFRFLNYSRIAAYSALAFVLLGCGLLAWARSEGLTWSLETPTSGGFVIGVVAMVLTAGISYQFTSRLADDAARVRRTLETLRDAQKLSLSLGDFTIGAGRYIITRDERALGGREKTKADIQNDLERLRQLTAQSPEQQERLGQIARIHDRRIAMSDEIIEKFRRRIAAGNLPAAGEESPLGQEYPALGREIERLIDVVVAHEYAMLERQQRQAAATSTKAFLLLPMGVLLGMAILMLSLFFLNASAAERAVTDARLARKRERLALLHEIDLAIIAAKTPEQVAEAVLPRLRDLLQLPRITVNLFDLEKREVEWLASIGRHRTHVGPGVRYPLDLVGDLAGLRRGEAQLIDVQAMGQRTEAQALLASGVRWYMVLPMIVGDELIGGLSFGGPEKEFVPEQIEVAQEVAAQVAIAIAQSRLVERARRADAQYRLVFENVPVGITMTAVRGDLLSVNPAFARNLGYASAEEALAGLRSNAQNVYAVPGAREKFLRILQRDGVVTNFETQHRRADGSPIWVSMSGRPIHKLEGEDSLLVTMIADITLRKEHEHHIERLSRVKDMQSGINTLIVRVRKREELFKESCQIAAREGRFKMAWIGVVDRDAMKIVPVASAAAEPEFLTLVKDQFSLREDAPLGNSMTARAVRERKPLVSNDIRADSRVLFANERIERGILSMAILPLMVAGDTAAVLALYADEVNFFDGEEVTLLMELADDIAFAMDNIEKQERLDYLSYYDALTGLPNRRLFHDRLSHSLHGRDADPRLIAVVLLDLERFRRVNESHGRHAGDALLRELGARLHQADDTAARIEADMYGLVLRGARTVAEVNRALEAIVTTGFAEPFTVGGEELRLACRAGVALYPNDGADADALLRNAEAALRRSKGADDHVVFYAPEMNARVAEALAIESKLRRAIERREFVLHYQPKVDLAGSRILGLEALIRWQDPEKGLVPPGRFIPVLEETGMIVEVGRWAIEQAFTDLGAWSAAGLRAPRVAVNVSAIQLQRKDFVNSVIEEIRRAGDFPERLELEITESLVMRNVEDSTRKLSILRGMGVTVSIDDFGTGYSSLSYLGRLPVDSLKIDRSFVSSMAAGGEAASIVSAIIALAHGLKLKVIAEGVETREQGEMLHKLGCDEAQGFFYSRPVPAREIEALLRGGRALPVT